MCYPVHIVLLIYVLPHLLLLASISHSIPFHLTTSVSTAYNKLIKSSGIGLLLIFLNRTFSTNPPYLPSCTAIVSYSNCDIARRNARRPPSLLVNRWTRQVGDVVNNASVNMILWHASSGAITARISSPSRVSRRHPRVTADDSRTNWPSSCDSSAPTCSLIAPLVT